MPHWRYWCCALLQGALVCTAKVREQECRPLAAAIQPHTGGGVTHGTVCIVVNRMSQVIPIVKRYLMDACLSRPFHVCDACLRVPALHLFPFPPLSPSLSPFLIRLLRSHGLARRLRRSAPLSLKLPFVFLKCSHVITGGNVELLAVQRCDADPLHFCLFVDYSWFIIIIL